MSQPLDPALIERVVSAAVAAVLAEMQAAGQAPVRGRHVAVVVGTTSVGLDYAVASLNDLRDMPLRLDWLTNSRGLEPLNRRLGQALCRDTADAGCPLALAAEVEAVVVAALDRPFALQVASTAPVSFESRLVFEALCLGKPVIAATDALGLDRPAATAQLRLALAEPLGRWEVFGAECVAAADLGRALRTSLTGPTWANAADNRALITVAEVETAAGELLIAADAIVTPLALDRARELGIKLRRLPA